MRIALLQTAVCADEQVNMASAARAVRWAADAGADLAVLPEMFCCPYETEAFPAYAEPAGGKRWLALSALARECGLYLVAGSMPELDGGRVYNTSFVFAPDGTQLARHRKVHLFDIAVDGGQHFRESDTLSPGSGVTVFDTPFGRCGLMICYDIRFPEYALQIAQAGAEVIVVPASFNQTTGPAHWELLFRARAMDNQVYMVGVASALDERASYHSYGHSIAVSPWGTVLAQMDTAPEHRILDLDLSEPAHLRRQMPFAAHRRARESR